MKKGKQRKIPGRKRYALTLMIFLMGLEGLAALLNYKNQTIYQAQSDLEYWEGWPKTRVIWEETLGTSWKDRTRLRLHILDGGCALAEYEWNIMEGWYVRDWMSAENREGWPVQASSTVFSDYYRYYVIGYLTDPKMSPEQVTFGWAHLEDGKGFVVDPEDRVTISPEDCISDGGITYFVCKFDLSQRLSEEEMDDFGGLYSSILVQVIDENGQPILWEDGWGEDFGDWMCIQ